MAKVSLLDYLDILYDLSINYSEPEVCEHFPDHLDSRILGCGITRAQSSARSTSSGWGYIVKQIC
jgi:hypothetical protein